MADEIAGAARGQGGDGDGGDGQGYVLWFTGLSGAGKSTLARSTAAALVRGRRRVEVLDADELRRTISAGLGFSKADRDENVRRIGWIAELLARNGVVALVAAIAPYAAVRAQVAAHVAPLPYLEVHCDCPLEVLVQRDTKGLYRRALAGEIANLTGVNDPYEAPGRPAVRVDTSALTVAQATEQILASLPGPCAQAHGVVS